MLRRLAALFVLLGACLLDGGCTSTPRLDDPLATLREVPNSPARHRAAMATLDADPTSEPYLDALHRVLWVPQYTVDIREEALDRLDRHDHDALMRTIRQRLPQMTAWEWLTRLCAIVAEREWTDLTPALVSSWARPTAYVNRETDRPEYLALVRLHGKDGVTDVVFDLMVESRGAGNIGLRTRCWNLLHRLGYRQRLVELLCETEVPADDTFLLDLQAAAVELGIVPYNREEILWLRTLRKPEHASFWSQAVAAVNALPPSKRADLELRDVAIVVSAALHDPELLELTAAQLYPRIDAYVRGQRHYSQGSDFEGFVGVRGGGADRLHDWRSELTWGDLAAMHIAIRALQVPEVVDHLFRYAEDDRLDESTEYGGVIALDEQGRFEILEFPPRIRHHDQKFIASQAMMDAGYTSLFHFHLHVQQHRNASYAGPGFGDLNYASNTRANCLVFTYVGEGVLNVDFYRHDSVVVDLGLIERR